MVESIYAGREQWTADSVMAILEEAKKDGSYDRASRWLNVDFQYLRQGLEVLEPEQKRADFLLDCYPGLYFLVARNIGLDTSKVME